MVVTLINIFPLSLRLGIYRSPSHGIPNGFAGVYLVDVMSSHQPSKQTHVFHHHTTRPSPPLLNALGIFLVVPVEASVHKPRFHSSLVAFFFSHVILFLFSSLVLFFFVFYLERNINHKERVPALYLRRHVLIQIQERRKTHD